MIDGSLVYNAADHTYADEAGRIRPSITALLEMDGIVDDTFFTDEGRFRGTVVHQRCLDLDLGALELSDLPPNDPYYGYIAAYDYARQVLKPRWEFHEEAFLHHLEPRFGGRPDRAGEVKGRVKSTLEIKSGGAHKAHAIQTALQAILLSSVWRIPAVNIRRYVCRLQADGKVKVDEFTRRADFDKAYDILRRFA